MNNNLEVRFRPFELADAKILLELYNKAKNSFNTTTIFWRPWGIYDFEKYIAESLSGDKIRLCITIHTNKIEEPVGAIELNNISYLHGRAELGIFILNTQIMNRGIGTDAVDFITNLAFNNLRLSRIFCKIFETNTAMIKVVKKAKFEQEGVWPNHFFIEGKYINAILYGKIKS